MATKEEKAKAKADAEAKKAQAEQDAKNAGNAGADNGTGSDDSDNVENTKNSKKTENADRKVVVWLKNTSYINDTQRLDAGVYAMDTVPERLRKSGKKDVEIFEDGVIPSKKLNQIGEYCGLKNPQDMEDEEILAKVISEPKAY